jgi:hypothetical protein
MKAIGVRGLQRNVQIAVCLDFHSNDTASERTPIILTPGTLGLPIQLNANSRPTVHV